MSVNPTYLVRSSRVLSGFLTALGVLALVWGTSAVALASSGLRGIAPGTMAFQSDGASYAAWQVFGSSSIVILDVARGLQREIEPAAGCKLESQEEAQGESASRAHSGRFLLVCGREQGVLNAETGTTQRIPVGPSGEHWNEVGTRYAEGRGLACRGYNECIALYDLGTGTVSVRRTPAIVNLDGSGAPAEQLCPALRRRLIGAERSAVTPAFAYEHGLFVHAAKRNGYVEIDRCKRPPIMIPGRGQPRDFDLGAGLLTWDTGYAAPGFDEEEESPYPSTLTAYRLLNWAVSVCSRQLGA